MREIRFENQEKTTHVVDNVDGKYSSKLGRSDINGRMINVRDYVPKTRWNYLCRIYPVYELYVFIP